MPGPQPFEPKLHMTDEDFLSITQNGQLCDAEGGLGLKEFELVMRNQVGPAWFPTLIGRGWLCLNSNTLSDGGLLRTKRN